MTNNQITQDSLIRVYKNAFSDGYCDSVISAWESLSRNTEERDNHDHSNNGFRRDKAIFMDHVCDEFSKEDQLVRKELTSEFTQVLMPCINSYLKEMGEWQNVYVVPYNMKVQKYSAERRGGYYKFHSEQAYDKKGAGDTYLRRYLTYMLYLNDVPEGEGETEFLHQGMRVQPRKGDLVVWPAFFTHVHRGNPVYTTDKYIATGWMLWDHPPEQETK